jgi:hypothetical protein
MAPDVARPGRHSNPHESDMNDCVEDEFDQALEQVGLTPDPRDRAAALKVCLYLDKATAILEELECEVHDSH